MFLLTDLTTFPYLMYSAVTLNIPVLLGSLYVVFIIPFLTFIQKSGLRNQPDFLLFTQLIFFIYSAKIK